MRTSALWLLPVLLAGAAGACATSPSPPGIIGSSGSASGSSGTSSGSSGASAGSAAGASGSSSGAVATASLFTQSCASPSAGSPVLRVLTRTEFDQTVNDIFPTI
jgi:hypothetical protein